MRHRFPLSEIDSEKLQKQIQQWVSKLEYAAYLDSNQHKDSYSRYDWIAALGAEKVITPNINSFEELQLAIDQKDWLFGHLSYDLKNEVEALSTNHKDTLGFAPLLFFIPKTVVYQQDETIWVESIEFEDSKSFESALPTVKEDTTKTDIELLPKTSRDEYLEKVESLKKELQFGNIYEINYCIEFSQHSNSFDPLVAFRQLNKSAAAPFSAFYKNDSSTLFCASPERYMQKHGDQVISQPIKGTIKRSKDKDEDEQLKQNLYNNEKERSENVMITDLVRNDLSRTASIGSVQVEELFGIYTFNTVHQMISTVKSKLDPKFSVSDLLKTTFPMGSMTGAPKVRAMKLIESHENFARNLYSGAVGYITPDGDFDFNVVIRSIFHNAKTNYLSARVGSAITIHCDAEKEYEECLLKAENLFAALRK